jgi:hypothetical protein
MKKIKYLLAICLVFYSIAGFGQFTITGIVIDSTTRDPLPGASVYCQNTTLGTITNKQGEFSLELKSGGYELIISYTGYQTNTIRISNAATDKLEIPMSKEDKSLGEVIIRSSNEVPDGWKKYGHFFTDNFIGTTPNAAQCKLENPDVLKFYLLKKSNKLRVLASEPLQITNYALGYTLRYQLDSFVYYYQTNLSLYRGFCLYKEIDSTDAMKKKWAAARQAAYEGSRLHFLRSYYDSSLQEDGFAIDLLDENDDTKFNRVTNPYDSVYYGYIDSTNEVELYYPRKFSVTYLKKKPNAAYIKKFNLPQNVSMQISYIELQYAIDIKENGYFYEQRDWINQGYWSWKNLADQLPYDYWPDEY